MELNKKNKENKENKEKTNTTYKIINGLSETVD